MYMRLRRHLTHQHHHLTLTINDDGHITANTTTSIGRIFFFFLFYFTNKYCYSFMYMQRHQHNHLTRWPSTTTATSQPIQPPWVVGFFLFLFSGFFFFTNKYCYSSMYMQRWLRRLTHQHKPPYTATINDDGHVMAKTTTATQPPYTQTINDSGHVTKETQVIHSRKQRPGRQRDSSGSRNSNSSRMPATAGTTVTRIPAADAAAEVVAAAAAATNHRCVFFFFSSLFFSTTNIYKFYTIEYTTTTISNDED